MVFLFFNGWACMKYDDLVLSFDLVVYTALFILACYCIGSITFGPIFAAIFKSGDPTSYGSGNVGTTNVFRRNKFAGILTLIFDSMKGYLVVLICNKLQSLYFQEYSSSLTFVCAFVVLLGHVLPIWTKKGLRGILLTWFSLVVLCFLYRSYEFIYTSSYSEFAYFRSCILNIEEKIVLYSYIFFVCLFTLVSLLLFCITRISPSWKNLWTKSQGGKGIATAFGVFLGLNYIFALLAIATWFSVFFLLRYSSLAAICGILVFCILFSYQEINAASGISALSFCISLFSLIIWTHRENIMRLIRKQENKA
jgi:glycerol-3-phosphate acyltransferase PlsY